MNTPIPFLSFDYMNACIKKDVMTAFEKFFDSKHYVLGPELLNFEKDYSKFNEVLHTVGVSNGMDALTLCLEVLEIGTGDEVIIPSNTYIATALAASQRGAKIVLVEPDPFTFNIDTSLIANAITRRTRAIVPVHLYGQPCNMDALYAVAKDFKIPIVEDNAQAHGAMWGNRMTGGFGYVNATSFYPGKNLGALGEAGAVTTNRQEIADKIKLLRNYGSKEKYFNEIRGHNMRMDELQAAVLSIKLKQLPAWTEMRQQIAVWYSEHLHQVENIAIPHVANKATHVYHQYVIKLYHGTNRSKFQKHLKENGIETMIHYPVPIHLQQAYNRSNYKPGDFPVAEHLAESIVSLPIWPGMTEAQVEYIGNTIKKFYGE